MSFETATFLNLLLLLATRRDDTSGEDAEDKEPTVAIKGRRTANSQGRRKGRDTRSMNSEGEETTTTPPLGNELGQPGPSSHFIPAKSHATLNIARPQQYS